MCAPGPSDVARESRGSAPVLAERPLRGIDGRSMGDPLGDEGRRAGVEGRKLGERCGVIRPATMGATGCGASYMDMEQRLQAHACIWGCNRRRPRLQPMHPRMQPQVFGRGPGDEERRPMFAVSWSRSS